MGISRSTFYDAPDTGTADVAVVAEMKAICDEFEAYGYRRVGAELRHRGMVVNAKKVRRLMREHALNPKRRRRFIATMDSNHNDPIFPDLANNMTSDGPNQLWVADITYVAVAANNRRPQGNTRDHWHRYAPRLAFGYCLIRLLMARSGPHAPSPSVTLSGV